VKEAWVHAAESSVVSPHSTEGAHGERACFHSAPPEKVLACPQTVESPENVLVSPQTEAFPENVLVAPLPQESLETMFVETLPGDLRRALVEEVPRRACCCLL